MTVRSPALLVTALLASTSAQQTTPPVVVLTRIEMSYPFLAEAARVTGTVSVRVAVRPNGSVSEATPLQDVPLLSADTVKAATGATFECRQCTEPVTPHTIAFVFSLPGSFDPPPPPTWKQTGDASSEVTVLGHSYLCDHCPSGEPARVRAARCLWLWHCSVR